MKKSILMVFILLAGFTLSSIAQPKPNISFGGNKVSVISGDLKFLKGEKDLKIEYSYDGMLVGALSESDYVAKHAKEMNGVKGGSGDEWKTKWTNDRKARYEPGFEKFFVKIMSKAGIMASQAANAKYKLIIKTNMTEPGLYTGVSNVESPTYINVEASFVETANAGNCICKLSCFKMIGNAGEFANFDIGNRITKSYENCGNYLAQFIVKTLKKIK